MAQPLLKVDFTIGVVSMRFARHMSTTSVSNVLGITRTNKMGDNKEDNKDKMGDNKDNKMGGNKGNQCGRRPD